MSYFLKKALTKPLWAGEKAYLWGRSIAGLRKTDRVMAFYPKTGSTWVRIFLYNYLAQQENKLSGAFDFDAVDAAMPEFANPSFFKPWPFASAPRLIKTHRPYQSFWKNRPTILFIREPRDTTVSFLHYANAKKEFGFEGGLDALMAHPELGLDRYFEFYMSWIPKADLIIRYEDMRKQPNVEFAKILRHMDIEPTEEDLAAALDASTMEKTREAQSRSSESFQSKFKEGFVFARKGESGEGKSLFTDAQEAYFQQRRAHWGFDYYD